ncbi:hypothetical protein EDB89DRAFT_1916965 [Lactarius sanguifluus]|nr:hypothetical protein EDB89DRAFT_1916965 [Lactarius sanguifluus]
MNSDVAGRGGDGVGGAKAASAAAVSTGGLFAGPKGWHWRRLWWWQCRGGSNEGCGCGGNGDDWYTDEREWERRSRRPQGRRQGLVAAVVVTGVTCTRTRGGGGNSDVSSRLKGKRKKKPYLRGAGGATGVGGGGSGCDGNGVTCTGQVHRELACPEGWCGGDCGSHGGFEMKGKKKTYQHGTRQNDSRRVACVDSATYVRLKRRSDERGKDHIAKTTAWEKFFPCLTGNLRKCATCYVSTTTVVTATSPRAHTGHIPSLLPPTPVAATAASTPRQFPVHPPSRASHGTHKPPPSPSALLSFPHQSLQHCVGKTPPSLIRRDDTMARDDMSRCNNLTTCKNHTSYEHRPPHHAKPCIDVRRAGGHDINTAPQPYGTAVSRDVNKLSPNECTLLVSASTRSHEYTTTTSNIICCACNPCRRIGAVESLLSAHCRRVARSIVDSESTSSAAIAPPSRSLYHLSWWTLGQARCRRALEVEVEDLRTVHTRLEEGETQMTKTRNLAGIPRPTYTTLTGSMPAHLIATESGSLRWHLCHVIPWVKGATSRVWAESETEKPRLKLKQETCSWEMVLAAAGGVRAAQSCVGGLEACCRSVVVVVVGRLRCMWLGLVGDSSAMYENGNHRAGVEKVATGHSGFPRSTTTTTNSPVYVLSQTRQRRPVTAIPTATTTQRIMPATMTTTRRRQFNNGKRQHDSKNGERQHDSKAAKASSNDDDDDDDTIDSGRGAAITRQATAVIRMRWQGGTRGTSTSVSPENSASTRAYEYSPPRVRVEYEYGFGDFSRVLILASITR